MRPASYCMSSCAMLHSSDPAAQLVCSKQNAAQTYMLELHTLLIKWVMGPTWKWNAVRDRDPESGRGFKRRERVIRRGCPTHVSKGS